MAIRRLVLVTALVTGLVCVPAALASQVRISSAPLSLDLPLTVSSTTTSAPRSKNKTCQVEGAAKKGSLEIQSSLLGSPRRTATVSCEQPPRGNLTLPQALAHSAATAIAIEG